MYDADLDMFNSQCRLLDIIWYTINSMLKIGSELRSYWKIVF